MEIHKKLPEAHHHCFLSSITQNTQMVSIVTILIRSKMEHPDMNGRLRLIIPLPSKQMLRDYTWRENQDEGVFRS